MFYLLVPSKWKLRLLVFDCIIIAITLVQFANHFDAITKTDNTTQISTGQAVNITDKTLEIDTQKLATLLEQTDKTNNSQKPE